MWGSVVVKIVHFIDYGSKDFKCYWQDLLSMRPQACQKDGSHSPDGCFLLLALISPLLTETKGKHLNEAMWRCITSESFMGPPLCIISMYCFKCLTKVPFIW